MRGEGKALFGILAVLAVTVFMINVEMVFSSILDLIEKENTGPLETSGEQIQQGSICPSVALEDSGNPFFAKPGTSVTNIINLQIDLENEQDFLAMEKILADLKSKSMVATFFFTESFAKSYPDAVSRIISGNHFIGLFVEEDVSGMGLEEQKTLFKNKISSAKDSIGQKINISNIKLKSLKQNKYTYYAMRELGINSLTSLFNDPAICEIEGETSEGTCGYCKSIGGKINHVYPTIYGFWAIPISTFNANGEEIPITGENFKNSFLDTLKQKYESTKATPEHITLRFITASIKPSVYSDSQENLQAFSGEIQSTGGVIKGFDPSILSPLQGGSHISSLAITSYKDPVCSGMDVIIDVTYSNTLYCPTYYFRTYGKYPSETNWKKLEEHSEFVTIGTHSYQAKFDIPEPEEVAKSDTKYIIRVVGQDCVASSGPCWPGPEKGQHQKMDEKQVDIAKFKVKFSGGLKQYEDSFKDKVYRRQQDIPNFDIEITPKLPENGKVKAEIYKKDFASRLKDIALTGGGNKYKGQWDWSNELKWKIPDEIRVGNYTLRLFVERNGKKICKDEPSFYTIFNTPASLGAADKKAYLYDDAGTRDENGIQYNSWDDSNAVDDRDASGKWLGWKDGYTLYREDNNYAYKPFSEHIFEIIITAADGETKESNAAYNLMYALENVIYYTSVNGNYDVGTMLGGITKERFKKAYGPGGEEKQDVNGQCLDYANGLTAIFRSVGIPARAATGIYQAGAFTYHEWTETYLENPPTGTDKWYVYDAMDYTLSHTPANDESSNPYDSPDDRKGFYYGGKSTEVAVGNPTWDNTNGGALKAEFKPVLKVTRHNAAASDALFERCENKKYDNITCNIDPHYSDPLITVIMDKSSYRINETIKANVSIRNNLSVSQTYNLTFMISRFSAGDDGRDAFGDPAFNATGSGILGDVVFSTSENVVLAGDSSISKLYTTFINNTKFPYDRYWASATADNGSFSEGGAEIFNVLPGYNATITIPPSMSNESVSITLNITNVVNFSINNITITLAIPPIYNTSDPLTLNINPLSPGVSNTFNWLLTPLRVSFEAIRDFHFVISSNNGGNQNLDIYYRITRPAELLVNSYAVVVAPPASPKSVLLNVTVSNVGDLNSSSINVTLVNIANLTNVTANPKSWIIPSLANGEESTQAVNVTYDRKQDFSIEVFAFDSANHNTTGILYVDVNFTPTDVRFTGIYSDTGVDIDFDTKYNFLRLTAQINVSVSAYYTVAGWLTSGNGTLISTNTTNVFISSGFQNVNLEFKGTDISSSGINGPYNLSLISISNDNFTGIDSRVNEYLTAAYGYAQFEALAELRGFVKRSDGSLVSSLEVSVTGPVVKSTYSDSSGYYSIKNLPKGNYDVIAYPSPYHNLYWYTTYTTLSSGEVQTINFTLEARGSVAGKVTDANGTPVNDTFVYEDVYEPPQWPTNETGDYIVPFLTAGSHTIRIASGQWFILVNNQFYGIGDYATVNVNLSETTWVDFTQQQPPGCTDNDGDGFYGNCSIFPDCNDFDSRWKGVKDNTYISNNTFICPGTYNIADQSYDGVLIFSANNVTLDCNGATIRGTDSGYGIYLSNLDNNTVKNCNVSDYYNGIYLYYSDFSNIDNSSIISNNNGISVYYSNLNKIKNSNFESNYIGVNFYNSDNNSLEKNKINKNYYGFYADYGADFNTLLNSAYNDNTYGGMLIYGDYNNISKNSFNNTGSFVYDIEFVFGADYNIIGGNSFYGGGVIDNGIGNSYCVDPNYFSPGAAEPLSSQLCSCTDSDGDGTYGFNATLCTIGNDCDDNNPSVIGVFDNTYINQNVVVCSGNYSINDKSNDGVFIFNASGVILDCNGASIKGTESGTGISAYYRDNIIIRNCSLNDYSTGIYLYGTDGSTLENVRSSSNYYGLYFAYLSNNTLDSVTLNSNSYGLYMYYSDYNNIINSEFNFNYIGVYLYYNSDYNKFLFSKMQNNSGYGIYASTITGNIFNYNNIEGNGYYNFYNTQPNNVSAEYNWWGTAVESEISNKIYDFFDYSYYGVVDFDPWLSAPSAIILVQNIQCEESGTWQECSGLDYGETITRVRASCSSLFGNVTNGTFSLRNLPDNQEFFSGFSSTFEDGFLVFDNPNILVQDSGDWELSTTCRDNLGNRGSNSKTWLVPWGSLQPYLISMPSFLNVSQNSSFTFMSGVKCSARECGSVRAILDPTPQDNVISSFSVPPSITGPFGIAHTGDNIWISDLGSTNANYEVTPTGNLTGRSFSTAGYADIGGLDMAWDGEYLWQYMFVLSVKDDVYQFSRNGTVISSFATPFASLDVGGIAYDGENIWTSYTYYNTSIFKFSTNGLLISSFPFLPDIIGLAYAECEDGPSLFASTFSYYTPVTIYRINPADGSIRSTITPPSGGIYGGGLDFSDSSLWWVSGGDNIAYELDPGVRCGVPTKGIIPMFNGTPFYTTDKNPREPSDLACLQSMRGGDSCNQTWNVFATGNSSSYNMFTQYKPVQYSSYVAQNTSPSVNVTITNITVNRAPVLNPIGNKIVNENQLLSIQLSASDPDNDTLTFGTNAGSVLPSPFSFSSSTGLFLWTPTFQDSGNYSVTFNVSDGQLSDQETITITVSNVNRAPVLNPIGNKIVNATQTLLIQLSASDPDNDTLTFGTSAGSVLPSPFTFSSSTGLFNWTPRINDTGNYSVLFNVTDGFAIDSETIQITVLLGFVCGDPNADTKINLQDIIYLVNYLFKGGPEPKPVKIAGDANGDNKVNLQDIIHVVNYLFKGGPKPANCGGSIASLSSGSSTIALGSAFNNFDGTYRIPISESNNVAVAGNKIEITYDPSKVSILNVTNTSRTSGLSLIVNDDKKGKLTIGLLTPDGSKVINSGTGTIVNLRVKGTTSSVKIGYGETADTQAREMKTAVVNPSVISKTTSSLV